ncbi:peptidoglycan-binding protein [Pacificispira sp.]|uniref:peptidoglycan-binding protein n=1 Tax=Pacificispira sp. TaxID=2888761 RepID=UPI003BAB72C7
MTYSGPGFIPKGILPALLIAAAIWTVNPVPPLAQSAYDRGFAAFQSGDYSRAADIWTRLAIADDVQAQNSLGYLFKHGLGVHQSHQEAVYWYERAASQGRTEAIYDLAVMYDDGLGVPRDIDRAQALYQRAARNGFAPAHNNLGILLEKGRGLTNDRRAAYFHYTLADRIGGTEKAAENRRDLAGRLPPEDVAILNRMAARASDGALYPGWPPKGSAGWSPPPVADAAVSPAPPILSAAEVKALQGDLARLGYDPGPVDGILGPATRRALRAFAQDKGLSETGSSLDMLAEAVAEDAAALPDFALSVPDTVVGSDPFLKIAGRLTGAGGIVTIDGEAVSIAADGSFDHGVYVIDGERTVTVIAQSEDGVVLSKSVTLRRDRQETDDLAALAVKLIPLNPIRTATQSNPDAVALIIGTEKYRTLPDATFADRDAKAFADYAQYVLGVPPSRIKTLVGEDAGFGAIRKALSLWLPTLVQKGQSDVYVFFAGHGLTDGDAAGAYLLPYDGDAELLQFLAVQRGALIDELAAMQPRQATVFLDTCFSGPGRSAEMLVAARPVFSVQAPTVPPTIAILSAASGRQVAGTLDQRRHGLFSYFLMRGLEGEANTNDDDVLTLGELSDWVHDKVRQAAGMLGRPAQTPQLDGDGTAILVRYRS